MSAFKISTHNHSSFYNILDLVKKNNLSFSNKFVQNFMALQNINFILLLTTIFNCDRELSSLIHMRFLKYQFHNNYPEIYRHGLY